MGLRQNSVFPFVFCVCITSRQQAPAELISASLSHTPSVAKVPKTLDKASLPLFVHLCLLTCLKIAVVIPFQFSVWIGK